jgi:hypothetical protein
VCVKNKKRNIKKENLAEHNPARHREIPDLVRR